MRIFEAYDMLSIADVMRPGDVYMEIGAHKGRFLEASGLLRYDCRYLLYEPGDVFVQLEAKVTEQRKAGFNVIAYAEAIWAVEGAFDYHVDASEGQGNTLVEGVHPKARKVPTITLEQALARHQLDTVRFLAINAEQAEYEILKSSAMDRVQFLTLEFHPGKSGIDTKAFMKEHLPQFELLQFGREGDAYNQWLGKHRTVTDAPGGS